jgi:hypothetical protein
MNTYGGGRRRSSIFLDLDFRLWSVSRSARFTTVETFPGIHSTENWVGPRAGLALWNRKISCPCQELNLGHPARSPSSFSTPGIEYTYNHIRFFFVFSVWCHTYIRRYLPVGISVILSLLMSSTALVLKFCYTAAR